jgi:two-component system NtrC family response regulator
MRNNGQAQLIGVSPAMRELREEIERVARSDAKVMITGASGAGKEVVARAINHASPRAAEAFVAVNCAGIPETLLESELFGHVKGSFTGAYRDKPGKLEMADNGTIFLDEIGEMTLRMQGLLLRFLETGEIQKVGSERAAQVGNVRVVTATNRSLPDLIADGRFREDLYYRINVIHIVVPPLRDRRDDIPLLVEHFLSRFVANHDSNGGHHRSAVRSASPEAMDALTAYSWPGNVRQLENVIERLVVTGQHDVVQLRDLPHEIRSPGPASIAEPMAAQSAVADALFRRLVEGRESFWTAVYPLYMNREITKGHVRDLVHKGLEEARGNYRIVLRLFNMESSDYKRFLNFLRKHECQLPFKEYR